MLRVGFLILWLGGESLGWLPNYASSITGVAFGNASTHGGLPVRSSIALALGAYVGFLSVGKVLSWMKVDAITGAPVRSVMPTNVTHEPRTNSVLNRAATRARTI